MYIPIHIFSPNVTASDGSDAASPPELLIPRASVKKSLFISVEEISSIAGNMFRDDVVEYGLCL